MPLKLIGSKLGMTRYFMEDGTNIPVTVIEVRPNVVTQLRTAETDGYTAVQIGYGDAKPRNATMPVIGHDAKAGAAPKRMHREFRVDEADLAEYTLGQELGVDAFTNVAFVDVAGTSKGKGTQGVMKLWNFKGQLASHGVERKHRSPGSIGGGGVQRGTGPKLFKGKKMGGRMGNERVTVRSLPIIKVDTENNLLLVKGPVPGPNKGLVEISLPTRLYKSKARKQAEKAAG